MRRNSLHCLLPKELSILWFCTIPINVFWSHDWRSSYTTKTATGSATPCCKMLQRSLLFPGAQGAQHPLVLHNTLICFGVTIGMPAYTSKTATGSATPGCKMLQKSLVLSILLCCSQSTAWHIYNITRQETYEEEVLSNAAGCVLFSIYSITGL